MTQQDTIIDIVRASFRGVTVTNKIGKSVLQPAIAAALVREGFDVDVEDSRMVLPAGLPVWRSKDDGLVVPTKGRRRIDVVVYKNSRLAALIETESDLDDLRVSGVTRRNGHYDVYSIARRSDGNFFDSYNSLERMASAAMYQHLYTTHGEFPSVEAAERVLDRIASDEPADQNPDGLPLILVSGRCRPQDRPILALRLASLNAELICVAGPA